MKLPLSQIIIDPRLRIDHSKVTDIAESMMRLGQIAPIIIEQQPDGYHLIDGGQRYKAAELLGWVEIQCALITELNDLKRLEVEIEANEKRSGFTWQERSLAYLRLHKAKGFSDPTWSVRKLRDLLGKSLGHVSEALSVADALERTKEQKTGWEKGLWACENFYAATSYLAMVNENAALAEIERRKKLVAINLGNEQPAPVRSIVQTMNITEQSKPIEERKPFKVELFNREPLQGECKGMLCFNGSMVRPGLIASTGAVIYWFHSVGKWLQIKQDYEQFQGEIKPLAFPLIWNTVRGKTLQDCPFYLNYKLGLFIPMPDYHATEPMPAVITCPPDEGSNKIPPAIVEYSLDAISREGDKIWLPYGRSVVEVAQCKRIPVWTDPDVERSAQTLAELKFFYEEQHGKCEFI